MACTETYYITSATSKLERLDRINQIIEGLELHQITVIGNSDIGEYQIDDGQIKIRTIYRSASDIAKAILSYTRIKNQLLSELNGRQVALRPWQGMS